MMISGGTTPLAMRPVALVAIWMLVHVVGIGRGKYDCKLVATRVVLPRLLLLMLLLVRNRSVIKLFFSEVAFFRLPIYPLAIGGTLEDI